MMSQWTRQASQTPTERKERLHLYWRWFLTGASPGLSISAADLDAFKIHNREQLRRNILFFFLLLVPIDILFWSTDKWVFQDHPEVPPVFDSLRSSLVVIGFGILAFRSLPRISPYIGGILGGALINFSVAYNLGKLGGPSTPWFHFVYTFMMSVLIVWVTPLERIGISALAGLVVLGGYFGLHQEHLSDTLASMALANFTFTLGFCHLLGLYNDDRRLRLFLANREVENARNLLRDRVLAQSILLSDLHARLDTLKDAERKELAQELHDELGQLLTAQRLVLEATKRRYQQNGSSIESNLGTLQELLDRFERHFRNQLNALRPSHLAQGDISSALRDLTHDWSSRTGIRCQSQIPASLPNLDEMQAGSIYRCVQEALTNVARHAHASEVTVSLEAQHGRLRVVVRDNGVGMEVGQHEQARMGLSGIRERIENLRGNIDVRSSPEQGTTLSIDIPVVTSHSVEAS